MKKEWTKGEFKDKGNGLYSLNIDSKQDGLINIISCNGLDRMISRKDVESNLNLCVAAPDMYEALNDLLIYCRLNKTSQLESLIKQAEMALNKANGL